MSNIESASNGQCAEVGTVASQAVRVGGYTKASMIGVIGNKRLPDYLREAVERAGAEKIPQEESAFDRQVHSRQTKCLMWRWGLLAVVVTALFWTIYWLVTGSVPVTTQILWAGAPEPDAADVIQLPVAVSRWWDVMFAPVWAVCLVGLIQWSKVERSRIEGLRTELLIGLGAGLLVGAGFGSFHGLFIGLTFGLSIGLLAGLLIRSLSGSNQGISVGAGIILGTGLGIGLVHGLISGLLAELVLGLACGLIVGLGYAVKWFFRRPAWQKCSHWLAGH